MSKKIQAVLGVILVVAVILTLFLPVLSVAGNLEPSAAPAPTMKTLDQIPPTWSQDLPAAKRFELVLGGTGVLDKETGLVWEQSPSGIFDWYSAATYCLEKTVANKKGWRLPTVEELASLVDPSVASPGPTLPSGHPFSNVYSTFWSATTLQTGYGTTVYVVEFFNGNVGVAPKSSQGYTWCVRGGQGYDGHQ